MVSTAPISALFTFNTSLALAAIPIPAPSTAAILNPPAVTLSIVILLPAVIVTSSKSTVPSLNLNLASVPLSIDCNVRSLHTGAFALLLYVRILPLALGSDKNVVVFAAD